MFVEPQQTSSGSRPAEISADLCIVGAGPSAIACALQFDGSPQRVVVIETGGTAYDVAENGLGETEKGLRFGTADSVSNTRRFGGNSNSWLVRTDRSLRGVRLAPFLEADFEARAYVAHSGWPIRRADLAPFYEKAQSIFGLPVPDYGAEPWVTKGAEPLPLSDPRVRSAVYQFGDGHVFTDAHRKALEASRNVEIVRRMTVVALESEADGERVEFVHARSLSGEELRVRARNVVLAGGGLGGTQLLLSSLAEGSLRMGAAARNVGRYFVDHPLLDGGEFVPADPATLIPRMRFYDLRTLKRTPVMGFLHLGDETVRAEPVLNLSMMFFPRSSRWRVSETLSARQVTGFQSALRVREAVRDRRLPSPRDAVKAFVGIDGVARKLSSRIVAPTANLARGGWSELADAKLKRFDRFQVLHVAEQAPHWENRAYLGEERDALGMRRLTIDWRWHDGDAAATMRGQEIFAQSLATAGLGRFDMARDEGRPAVVSSTTGHWMGLTRMSRSAADGVVDADCRVHGVHNLFVASSSVFPTGSFANPTLTVVALSLRIADHLKRNGSRA